MREPFSSARAVGGIAAFRFRGLSLLLSLASEKEEKVKPSHAGMLKCVGKIMLPYNSRAVVFDCHNLVRGHLAVRRKCFFHGLAYFLHVPGGKGKDGGSRPADVE